METDNVVMQQMLMEVIEKLRENLKTDFGAMENRMDRKMEDRFSEMETRLDQKMEHRFSEMEKRMETSMERKFEEMDKTLSKKLVAMDDDLSKKLETMDDDLTNKLQDGLDKYATSVKYIKNYLSEPSNGFRPARPFSQQTVIPRSISTYAVQKVPSEPWDPPKWRTS